jgi:hypothetical protein
MTTEAHDLTPMERRLLAVVEAALEVMPPELYDECQALVALDPSVMGLRGHFEGDQLVLTWVGRLIARVDHHWLMTGEAAA